MKPSEKLIKALDHFTEMPAGRFSKALRDGFLGFLMSDREACCNAYFQDLCLGIQELFGLLDIIEKEQARDGRFKEESEQETD